MIIAELLLDALHNEGYNQTEDIIEHTGDYKWHQCCLCCCNLFCQCKHFCIGNNEYQGSIFYQSENFIGYGWKNDFGYLW